MEDMVGKYQASKLPGALTRITLGTSQQLGLYSFPPHQKLTAASRLFDLLLRRYPNFYNSLCYFF